MKSSITSAFVILTTASNASWVTAAYSGQQCTGQQLWKHENPGTIDLWCAGLEHWEATSSITINVSEDSDKSWEFELHHDGSCSGLNFGHFTRK
jgi:hypothetical protein